MAFRIEHDTSKREGFAPYRYRIYANDRLIAHYWHDHKGDEHGIEFVNGTQEDWPVGRVTDFIEGGGPKALVLSVRAIAYLKQKFP